MIGELREFKEHEESHRERFRIALVERNVHRCRSYHLCGVGGLTLGLLTGLCGRKAIAATTVAVESVVLRHLQQQITHIDPTDQRALETIRAIVDDEQTHHDRASTQAVRGGMWFRLVHPAVSASTRTVIWLGMRL